MNSFYSIGTGFPESYTVINEWLEIRETRVLTRGTDNCTISTPIFKKINQTNNEIFKALHELLD